MTLPTFQGLGTVAAGTGDITPAWPTHIADDVGFLIVETGAGEAVTAPSGWVAVGSSPQDSGGGGPSRTRLSVFWLRATGSSETDPTITDPGNHAIAHIFTIRGVETTGDPWHISVGAIKATNSETETFPGGTTTIDDCLILLMAAAGDDPASVGTVGTGDFDAAPTERIDRATGSGTDGRIFLATADLATGATFAAVTATVSTSERAGYITLALKPVGDTDVAAGLATETDTALATSFLFEPQAGLATETDTALVPILLLEYAAGLTTETDTALAISLVVGPQAGLVTETSTALAVTLLREYTVGLATETDTALATAVHLDAGLLLHFASMIG